MNLFWFWGWKVLFDILTPVSISNSTEVSFGILPSGIDCCTDVLRLDFQGRGLFQVGKVEVQDFQWLVRIWTEAFLELFTSWRGTETGKWLPLILAHVYLLPVNAGKANHLLCHLDGCWLRMESSWELSYEFSIMLVAGGWPSATLWFIFPSELTER